MSALPELPAGDDAPPPAAVAERLASLLPPPDREQAHAFFMQRILPSAVAGLEGHPRFRRAVELIYGDLGEQLLAAEPEDRLDALEAAADWGTSARSRRTPRRSPSPAISASTPTPPGGRASS